MYLRELHGTEGGEKNGKGGSGVSNLGPWTRGDVLDLHIFILLLIWLTLDRCNVYFADIINKFRNMGKYDNGGRRLL